eukprot:6429236-Heterocapsa_arctica.AAC.1
MGVALAFRPGEELETIRWFLEEVSKDLKRLEDVGRSCADGPRQKGGGHRVPLGDNNAAEQTIIDSTLSMIRDHPQCHLATYMPSRQCFKVIKKTSETDNKFIYLKCYTKKRKLLLEQVPLGEDETRQDDRAVEAVRSVFERALNDCIEYLEPGTEQ